VVGGTNPCNSCGTASGVSDSFLNFFAFENEIDYHPIID
jgi:hypothetical protein